MTRVIDEPGFWTFCDPERPERAVRFFVWSNPRWTEGGVIPDGYLVVIPCPNGSEYGRLSVRTHAWPKRGLPKPEWSQVLEAVNELLGPILSEPDPDLWPELGKDIPFDPQALDVVGIWLLPQP